MTAKSSDQTLTLDVYLAPRDMRASTVGGGGNLVIKRRATRYGYFQTSNFEISDDAMAITTSKIYTFEDLANYQEGDFILCYMANPRTIQIGIFEQYGKEAYYVGVIDSIELVSKPGQPNVLNLKNLMSIFDQDMLVTAGSGAGTTYENSWEDHVRDNMKVNWHTYDRYVDDNSQTHSVWNYNQYLSGLSFHRGSSTAWKYSPKDPFSVVNFYQYLVNGIKKYNVFFRIKGAQWNLPPDIKTSDGVTRHIYPQSGPGGMVDLDQFNLIDVDITRTDDSAAASYQIKDNTNDLYDWEFSTTVGTTEANCVRIFDQSINGNEQVNKRTVNGSEVTTVKALTNTLTRIYPYQNKSGNTIISDGIWYYVTTRGEIIGGGTQHTNADGSNARWAPEATVWGDGFSGELLLNTPDNEPDKLSDGRDNPMWWHRFDKYVQTPVKTKVILLDGSDRPANISVAGTGNYRAWYLEAARDALGAVAYAHQFKVKLSLDSELIDWHELYLGRSVYITYKGVTYKSLVTARELKSGTNYITIICGHNRHKLGALLQEKLN